MDPNKFVVDKKKFNRFYLNIQKKISKKWLKYTIFEFEYIYLIGEFKKPQVAKKFLRQTFLIMNNLENIKTIKIEDNETYLMYIEKRVKNLPLQDYEKEIILKELINMKNNNNILMKNFLKQIDYNSFMQIRKAFQIVLDILMAKVNDIYDYLEDGKETNFSGIIKRFPIILEKYKSSKTRIYQDNEYDFLLKCHLILFADFYKENINFVVNMEDQLKLLSSQ